MAKVMVRVANDPPPKKVIIPGFPDIPLYKPDNNIKVEDTRKFNPTTGMPLRDTERKTVNVDPQLVRDIATHAQSKGIDPYTALAISYQESGLNKDAPFNLNPDYFGKAFGNAQEGIESLSKNLEYAKSLQKRGVVPNTEEYFLQGNNGYGRIKKGHADLEGAHKIYGFPIPDEGVSLKENPLYGKTIISLRELLKNHPEIKGIVNKSIPDKKILVKVSK